MFSTYWSHLDLQLDLRVLSQVSDASSDGVQMGRDVARQLGMVLNWLQVNYVMQHDIIIIIIDRVSFSVQKINGDFFSLCELQAQYLI